MTNRDKYTIVPAPGPNYKPSKSEQKAIKAIRKVSERAKQRILDFLDEIGE